MHTLPLLCVIIICGTMITTSLTSKLKLCVEYQVASSRVTDGILTVIYNSTRSKCIIQCARHPICRAFNMLHDRGTCELLPDFGDCGEGSHHEGSTFIQLRLCRATVPWAVQWRNWSAEVTCLKWNLHDGTVSCPTDNFRGPISYQCLALTPHKGLYLPSWQTSPKGFRIVTVDEHTRKCPRGYLLAASPHCPVSWVAYKVGDPIPTRAVQVSTWTNGSPLYFVAVCNVACYMGYYLPHTRRSYMMAGRVLNPGDVFILLWDSQA